jgi:hypothetical protein
VSSTYELRPVTEAEERPAVEGKNMAIAPTATTVDVPFDDHAIEEEAQTHAGRRWPSSGAAYWALFVIVLATFLTFFEQVVFGMPTNK